MKFLVCVVVLGGCVSSGYQPIDGPTVKHVYRHGQPIFHVRSERIVPGFFGGGIAEAVAGVPLAEEAAVRARQAYYRVWGGFGLLIAAPLALGVGMTGSDRFELGLTATFGVSLIAYGLIIEGAMSAPIAHLDAINIYNDAVLLRAGVIKPPVQTVP